MLSLEQLPTGVGDLQRVVLAHASQKVLTNQLLGPIANTPFGFCRQQTIRADFVVAVLQYLFISGTDQNQSHIVRTKTLVHAIHTGDNFLSEDQRIFNEIQLIQTNIASPTVFNVEYFSKVSGQLDVSAKRTVAEIGDRLQRMLCTLLARFRIGLRDHTAPCHEVARAIEHAALGLQPVTASTPAFLLVGFQRFRHAGMNHVANIRFIDSHAKGHRRHNHPGLLTKKSILVFFPGFWRHSRVVGQGSNSELAERGAGRFNFFAADAVDDSRFAFMSIDDFDELIKTRFTPLDSVNQVGPIHRTDQRLAIDL